MAVRPLIDFLNRHQIKYVTISHSPAYTAQEIAASAHISGKEVAKTVSVWRNGVGPRVAELGLMVINAYPWSAPLKEVRLKKA